MRICFLLERGTPPRLNPVIAGCASLLEARGARVELVYPEEELWRLDAMAVDADLYLLKSDSELSLSLALGLAANGAAVLNAPESCLLAKDKATAAATLIAAGIPTPRSLVAAAPDRLGASLAAGPLILKAPRGYHGVGLTVAHAPADLPAADAYPELVFAQRYLDSARCDLKVLGIGDEVFAVRKAFAAGSFLQAGTLTDVSPELERLARACAAEFGLRLYGLDVAEGAEGLQVVDVNYFPGYRGVPRAAERLADFIEAAALTGR